jgi:hypothetical protein
VGDSVFAEMTRLMSWCGWLMPIGFAGGEIPLLKNHSIVGVFTDAWAEKVPARKRCHRREVDAARRGRPVASACERRAAARTSRRRDERSGEPNRARPSRLALQQQTGTSWRSRLAASDTRSKTQPVDPDA